MENCEGCKALEARLKAAEMAIEELRGRVDSAYGFSDKHRISISVPASGGDSLPSPFNGYIALQAVSTIPGAYISLGELGGIATSLVAGAPSQNLWVYLPVKAEQSVKIGYASVTKLALYILPSYVKED